MAHLESFDIGQQLDDSRCRDLGIEPNIWPDLPGFRDVILDYYENVTRLGRALGEVFSLSVVPNTIPVGGYGGWQTLIDYGNLTYKPDTPPQD